MERLPSTPGEGEALRRQRRANLRLALILASTAAAFFVGFVVKMSFFGGHG